MKNLYQEHLQDSAFPDTWQAAEADQFLRDESATAVLDRADDERDLLENFRKFYPTLNCHLLIYFNNGLSARDVCQNGWISKR